MTSVAERFAVRVMVPDAWDQVFLAVDPTTTIAEVKRQALERALKRATGGAAVDDFVVKFRGGLVIDETASLAAVGVGANAPLIVLRARRRPVR